MDIIPFQGYRYNSDILGDPAICIAPPYDVIGEQEQETLYAASPYNIVRIIKGVDNASDREFDNVYTRAATTFREFVRRDIVKQDASSQFYVYAQDFSINSQSFRRSGLVGLGKLETYGDSIKPHEQTLAGPKADRLNLTRAIKTQVGQIFMLYSEPEKTIDALLTRACEGGELLCHCDDDQVTHRLFAIDKPNDIRVIAEVMKSRSVFIADGHHRFETALNYQAETDNPRADYQLMTFINTRNEGLVVLPTHRLVKNVEAFDKDSLLGQLQAHFDVARLAYDDVVQKKEKLQEMQKALALELENGDHAFGIYFNDGAFYVATLRDENSVNAIEGKYSTAWRKLDVSILHKLILDRCLGIDEAALTAQTHCEYIKDFGDATSRAIDRVDETSAQVLFFMNPTGIESVEAVAMAGEKMPQKSTFFFPKIFSGLVMNVLE